MSVRPEPVEGRAPSMEEPLRPLQIRGGGLDAAPGVADRPRRRELVVAVVIFRETTLN